MKNVAILFLALMMGSVAAASAGVRTWTDRSGTHHIEAELVNVENGKVQLKRPDGSSLTISIDKLSQADQEFVTSQSAGAVAANGAGAESRSVVKLVGLSVGKAPPKAEPEAGAKSKPSFPEMMVGRLPIGTVLVLWVADLRGQIIRLDDQASRIVTFTDDKDTNLLTEKVAGAFPPPLSAQIREEDHRCIVEVLSSRTPAPEAVRITLKATIVLRCGMGEKTTEHKDLSLKTGGDFPLGSATVKIKKGQGFTGFGSTAAKTTVSLSSDQPFDAMKGVMFIGPNGDAINNHQGFSSSAGFAGHMTYQRDYGLDQAVDTITLKLTEFEKVEVVNVPVVVETGLGF